MISPANVVSVVDREKSLKKNLKKFYTACTVKLSTAPWKQGGTVNEEYYLLIIHKLSHIIVDMINDDPYIQIYGCNIGKICWELDTNCQLHIHTVYQTFKPVYRTKVIKTLKEQYPKQTKNTSIFLQDIKTDEEVYYWQLYCEKNNKGTDYRELYYRLQHFYHNKLNGDVIEDFSDLADYDIEYDSKLEHFKFIDSSKCKLW